MQCKFHFSPCHSPSAKKRSFLTKVNRLPLCHMHTHVYICFRQLALESLLAFIIRRQFRKRNEFSSGISNLGQVFHDFSKFWLLWTNFWISSESDSIIASGHVACACCLNWVRKNLIPNVMIRQRDEVVYFNVMFWRLDGEDKCLSLF